MFYLYCTCITLFVQVIISDAKKWILLQAGKNQYSQGLMLLPRKIFSWRFCLLVRGEFARLLRCLYVCGDFAPLFVHL
jgi:hypothetical protein